MASEILHIKDSYYFEVPKMFWHPKRDSRDDFPDFWVRLDPEYQLWEAENLYDGVLAEMPEGDGKPSWPELRDEYVHWKHDHANQGKPLVRFLEEAPGGDWFRAALEKEGFAEEHAGWLKKLETVKTSTGDVEAYVAESPKWTPEKIEGYNKALRGKILIPQPFGELRNLYERQSGFCISKFMIIELAVALIISAVFIVLARRVVGGGPPRGRLWNLFEAILLFLRDQVARPAIGHDADKYVPLLWTMFLFILGLNLCGMLPWAGAPTGAFGATFGLAVVTLATSLSMGVFKLGPVGFWSNMIPKMDLPFLLKPLGIIIQFVVLVIEVAGMLIRHGVLSVRLLANMVAGHLVLLGVMTMAFSVEGAISPTWWVAAPIALVGSTLFSCLELFVAFLQAYIFTFLSALFIGAATHHH